MAAMEDRKAFLCLGIAEVFVILNGKLKPN
jgi:hypothetical protein